MYSGIQLLDTADIFDESHYPFVLLKLFFLFDWVALVVMQFFESELELLVFFFDLHP